MGLQLINDVLGWHFRNLLRKPSLLQTPIAGFGSFFVGIVIRTFQSQDFSPRQSKNLATPGSCATHGCPAKMLGWKALYFTAKIKCLRVGCGRQESCEDLLDKWMSFSDLAPIILGRPLLGCTVAASCQGSRLVPGNQALKKNRLEPLKRDAGHVPWQAKQERFLRPSQGHELACQRRTPGCHSPSRLRRWRTKAPTTSGLSWRRMSAAARMPISVRRAGSSSRRVRHQAAWSTSASAHN